MPDTTNTPTAGAQQLSGVQPGVPFHDLTKWATKAPEGETLISTTPRSSI